MPPHQAAFGTCVTQPPLSAQTLVRCRAPGAALPCTPRERPSAGPPTSARLCQVAARLWNTSCIAATEHPMRTATPPNPPQRVRHTEAHPAQ